MQSITVNKSIITTFNYSIHCFEKDVKYSHYEI